MIVVRIYWDNQAICGLSVCGHSDYSPRGSDIVCSAVSALAQTAVLALDAVVGVKPRFVRQEGLLLCKPLRTSVRKPGKGRDSSSNRSHGY